MKYNLEKSYDKQKAQEYLNKLSENESKIELKKIYPRRSLSQNNYLHVLFTLWGQEFGYTVEETKQTVKWELGYTYIKEGLKYDTIYYQKTSEMDTKELTDFIEGFRDWSSMNCDLYLPSSEEYMSEQIYFDNEVEKSNQ